MNNIAVNTPLTLLSVPESNNLTAVANTIKKALLWQHPSSVDNHNIAERSIALPSLSMTGLGHPAFMRMTGTKMAYMAGAMANGIASVELVVALGQQGLLGSFGSAGLPLVRLAKAIEDIQQALPNGPYCFNLIHNPANPDIENKTIELYINQQIKLIEASAFMDITLSLVHYRATGLRLDTQGQIHSGHRIIAKLSRQEVAEKIQIT